MRIIISDSEKHELEINVEKQFFDVEEPTFEQVYMRLMSALEGITAKMLNETDVPDPKSFRQHMYDILDGGFGQFLKKVFPEVKLGDFDLTAAAIVKAQDEIIQEATDNGLTYQEVLDKYNDIANDYVKARMN